MEELQFLKNINTIDELKPLVLTEIPQSYENFDVILGDPYFINQFICITIILIISYKITNYIFDI